jgi:hypothetical protein
MAADAKIKAPLADFFPDGLFIDVADQDIVPLNRKKVYECVSDIRRPGTI